MNLRDKKQWKLTIKVMVLTNVVVITGQNVCVRWKPPLNQFAFYIHLFEIRNIYRSQDISHELIVFSPDENSLKYKHRSPSCIKYFYTFYPYG